MNETKIIVNKDDELIRIDAFLVNKLPIYSRSTIKKMIDERFIKVNDEIVKANYIIKVDDEIVVKEFIIDDYHLEPENIALDIIYQDSDLLVINKPSGIIVHPGAGATKGTLVNALLYHIKDLSRINGELRPGIVHRIDKDTSGLLVVAKNDFVHQELSKQLQDKTLFRKYIAITHGQFSDKKLIIDAPIGRDKKERTKMAVTSMNSKKALTKLFVKDVFKDYSYLEIELETGRTHQIRVHLAYINHPIVGDPKYGFRKDNHDFGQYLHAYQLGFIHPRTNEYMEFKAPVPQEFNDFLDSIKYE
jgi:23S rRNA pseudouridine1911/1915/1917 synthase